MKIDILTLFPEMFSPLEHSIVGKAREKGLLEINYHNFRENAEKARHVDDEPYGGCLLYTSHMDVIQERLEREFNIDLIMTAPSVIYKVNLTDGEALDVSNPSEFPDPTKIASIEEPYVKAQIMVPQEFVGAVMELAQRKRCLLYTSRCV